MNQDDKQAIEGLFGRLATVEHQSAPRDQEAERLIADTIRRQPGAPYYMAQTVVVQEQALAVAEDRIARLEDELAQARQGGAQSGGFLSRLLGGGAPPTPRHAPPLPQQQMPLQGRSGGGFLAGAAQTAMGVAGGVLLGNAIGSMFAQDAQAGEAPAEDPVDPGVDDGGEWEEF